MNSTFITSYERDNETELDFAQARMYSNNYGRFTTVDPLMASAQTGNPQTWNRYIYALNNPLKYTDPDGLKSKPVFRNFEDLTEDERRILNASSVEVEVIDDNGDKVKKALGGQELYDTLAAEGNKKGNKQLAGFLNQTAVLASTEFTDGSSAIDYVGSVSEIKQDRIIATLQTVTDKKTNITTDLVNQVSNSANFLSRENAGLFHGQFSNSFRRSDAEGSQQISFSPTSGNTLADIDVDARNPKSNFGNTVLHGYTVVKNTAGRVLPFVGSRSNPYGIRRILEENPRAVIKPSYTVKD